MRTLTSLVAAALVCLSLAACNEESIAAGSLSPEAQKGANIIASSGCGTCHTIPGIENADGLVGPPLNHMAKRTYIAGVVRNSPEHMAQWVMDPQSIVPNTAMPNLGLSRKQANAVVAYLATLD
jgi:cytochrome c